MPRAPLQVLVLPFRRSPQGEWQYGLLRRSDDGHWQGVAGGGEDDEQPFEAALRELEEEAGWSGADVILVDLDTRDTVQADCFAARTDWPSDLYVVPQHFYAVRVDGLEFTLSDEHTEFCWFDYDGAYQTLRYDSNKTALWELHERLQADDLRPR